MTSNFKLILTDLDNTFLRSNKTISQFSLDVINECKQKGVVFGVATARSERTAEKYLNIIKPDLIISNGGALAKYKGKIIFESMLPVELSNNFIKDCLTDKNIGEITVETRDFYFRNNKKRIEAERDYLNATFNDYSKPLNKETYKITCEVYKPESAQKLLKKYPLCCYTPYRGELWGRFAHKDSNKIDAIKAVAQHFNIKKEQVICFGDDTNDIGMIDYFYGVAVSNAIAEVKQVAKKVIGSNDEDAVAKYIKNNIL